MNVNSQLIPLKYCLSYTIFSNCQKIYMTMAFVHHLREICETGLTFILLARVVQRGT